MAIRLVDSSRPPSDAGSFRLRTMLPAVALLIVAGLGFWAFWWNENEGARAVRALPRDQRVQILDRTMKNLRTLCDPAPPRSLRDYCHEQAAFMLKFPECDEPCREIARRHVTQPRR